MSTRCPGCDRLFAEIPLANCPTVVHWQARAERLEATINTANGALFDADPHDVEHTIACHADTLPSEFRRVAAGVESALQTLQVIIQERF